MATHSERRPGRPATKTGKVLHVLSQRPLLTGSGITLDALVRLAAAAGWEQAARRSAICRRNAFIRCSSAPVRCPFRCRA